MPPKDEGRAAKELSRTSKQRQKPRTRKRRLPPPPPPPGTRSSGSVEAPGSSSQVRNPSGLRQYGFIRANAGINWRDVDSNLLSKLNALGRQMGQVITLTSGFRTHTEQRRLYEAYLRGEIGLAAPPGSSNHEHGNAVDALIDGRAIADVVPEQVLNRAGLRSLAHLGDAVHVELSDGGGSSGAAPSSSPAVQQPMAPTGDYVPPAETPQYTEPSYAPAPTADALPFETDDDMPPDLLTAQQRSETWQLIAQQPGASPETQMLARLARTSIGG